MADEAVPRPSAGLRTRASIAFALLALVLSISLSLLTYGLARQYLVSKRESLATQQTMLNARTVANFLQDPTVERTEILVNLATLQSRSVLHLDGRWFAASIDIGRTTIPRPLQTITGNRIERQRVKIDGEPFVIVAVPIAPNRGAYYEVVPLRELENTLRTLGLILAFAAAITTLLGALVGRSASRRVLRPINVMAKAAVNIAHGEDEPRLTTNDADLRPFITSFNDMVDALQERIDREARFASDVSHELRTPLTAIRSAVDVLDRRVDDNARPALDILRRQTVRFESLVLDLLEISRFDAHSEGLNLDATRPTVLVNDVLRRGNHTGIDVEIETGAPDSFPLDRRRIERVLTNLVENANNYAGGATRIGIGGDATALRITVDDAGPGISVSERDLVFDRFHRGDAGRDSSTPGTGLGLAIAAEHCRLHGGRLRVSERPGGGARFIVEIPREQNS